MGRICCVFILICFRSFSFAQAGIFEFSKSYFDFGNIEDTSNVIQHDFIFRNVGNLSAQITEVKANCPCITPIWTKSEVGPGEYGFVKIKLNKLKQPGYFDKSVIVSATDSQIRFNNYLNVKGNVLINNHSKEENINQLKLTDDTESINDDFLEDSEISLTVQAIPEDIDYLESIDTALFDSTCLSPDIDSSYFQLELQVLTLKSQLNGLIKNDSLSHLIIADLQDSIAQMQTIIERREDSLFQIDVDNSFKEQNSRSFE